MVPSEPNISNPAAQKLRCASRPRKNVSFCSRCSVLISHFQSHHSTKNKIPNKRACFSARHWPLTNGTNCASRLAMNSQDTQIGYDKFAPFIESQLRVSGIGSVSLPQETPKLAITISRQSGSGGHAVGEKLAQYLQAHSPQPALPWMVF